MTTTPDKLANLYAQCFPTSRPWSAEEFHTFLMDPKTIMIGDHQAFALGQIVLDEVELLTIAVDPGARRAGYGRARLADFETRALNRGACICHLEVAVDNMVAQEFYFSLGYGESGRRKGYYVRETGPKIDAILLCKSLILR